MYEFLVTVPADTPKAEPVQVEALVHPGMVTHVSVEFPRGCHQMVHCIIVEGKYQLWPRNPEGTMASDDYVVEFSDFREIKRGRNLLLVYAWSPGSSYSHDLRVRITVLPKKVASMVPLVEVLTKLFSRLFGP